MKTLVALKPLVYASKSYNAGDQFRAANHHAGTLIAVRLAAEVSSSPTPAPAKDERAVPRYRRRDMRAED